MEGTIEVKKIHERLEKWSRKKVEILSQETKAIEKKETKKVRPSYILHHISKYSIRI